MTKKSNPERDARAERIRVWSEVVQAAVTAVTDVVASHAGDIAEWTMRIRKAGGSGG